MATRAPAPSRKKPPTLNIRGIAADTKRLIKMGRERENLTLGRYLDKLARLEVLVRREAGKAHGPGPVLARAWLHEAGFGDDPEAGI